MTDYVLFEIASEEAEFCFNKSGITPDIRWYFERRFVLIFFVVVIVVQYI